MNDDTSEALALDDESLTPEEEAALRGEVSEPEDTGTGSEDAPQEQAAAQGKDTPSDEQDDDSGEDDDSDIPEEGDEGAAEKVVPLKALHAERRKRKDLDAQLRDVKEQIVRYDERFKSIADRLREQAEARAKPQQDDEPAPPDPEEDIFGYTKYLEGRLQKIEGGLGEANKARQAEQELSGIVDTYRTDAIAFARKHADFADAYNMVIGKRHEQLEKIGVTDPQERASMIAEEEMGVVERAIQANRSPAETMYNLAQTFGYTPPDPEAADATGATEQTKTNGSADKIKKLAMAQEKEVSLSSASGSEEPTIDLEALANMDEEEFSKLDTKAITRILRGG